MPPKLALIFCSVFVLFLLWLDRRQGPKVSHASWIPTFWMFYIATKPLALWFGIPGDEDGSPIDRNFGIGVLCGGLFILFRRKCNWAKIIKENIWVILLIGFMLLSIFWSDIPYISFKRWIREITAVLMALLVATEREPAQAMQSIFRRTVYVLIPFSVLLIKYFPELGLFYVHHEGITMWTGVTTHKNGLGRLCLITMFFLIWTFVRRWQGRSIAVNRYQTIAEVFILFLIIWLFKGPENSYSATSIGSLAVGIAMYICLLLMKKYHINIGSKTLMAMVACVIGYGIVTVLVGGSTFSTFTSSLGRNETLTGRKDIWETLLPIAMESPIFGKGFGGFWTPEISLKYFEISECHNGYLEVFLELGIVGIFLVSIFLLSCCNKAIKALHHDFDWGCLWFCFLLMVALYNATESSVNTFTSHLTALLLFLLLSYTVPNTYNHGAQRKF